MEIIINNQKRSVESSCTVSELLKVLNQPSYSGVAVAVNNQVVPKNEWDKHRLAEHDSVLLVTAAQGG